MSIRMNTRNASGFSLIEILIAVVVLATGLLALTALQGRLAQASAEAKVRSRVATVLTSRLDELRASQYASIPPAAGSATATNTVACTAGNWVCTAQNESGVTGLSVAHNYERFMDVGGTFTSSGAAAPNLSTAEFKRITLTATWTDATGVGRRLAVTTDVSPLALTANQIPNAPGGAGSGGRAVVRQDNPAGPGVIPIAIGGGEATAASNPRPEVIGRKNNESIVGTRFDVLTYEGLSGPARIQRRVETAVVACKCEYGAGGTNLGVIYQTAKWPAQWTGERYEVVVPAGAPAAPGEALAAGPVSGVEQSPLCTDCCRDHHDSTTSAEKFDPQRTGGYEHYNVVSGSLSPVGTASGTRYLEACRLVRVDGFWRTATDMYAKHFGLIKTETVSGTEAKSGAPDATAVTSYQTYVKGYLAGYNGTQATIANAADGGQVSGTINISAPPPVDERYLHARGLYVDHLHTKALTRITKARDACSSGDATECMLPYLPFTTINATELAYWEPRTTGTTTPNTTVLSVASGSSLVYDPLQPTRGRTNAKPSASNGATSDAVALITRSNAGVAIAEGVDPADDAAEASDKQNFRVTASGGSGSGQSFSVRLSGLPQTSDDNSSNDPAVAWLNATGNANCNATVKLNNPNRDLDPNDYACNTFGALGIATTVTVRNYHQVSTTQSTSQTCTVGGKTVTESYPTPRLVNYAVSAATVGGTPAISITTSNDNTPEESTVVQFAAVAEGSVVLLTFTNQNNGAWATIRSCTLNGGGNKIQSITWNEAWAQ